MKRVLRGCAALLVLAWVLSAGNVSYVVLFRSNSNSLVRISDDGASQTVIARGAGGSGLARDVPGDYIVAAISSLLRVTPSGVVSTIALAPIGSQFLSVAVDSSGNYIVADNRRHSVWRISPNGDTVKRVAMYPVRRFDELEDVGIIVDPLGDYLVMESNSFVSHFWRISPEGRVTSIPLRGDSMTGAGPITGDGSGAYVVASSRDHALFHITPDGEVRKFATVGGRNLTGIARNPETGEFVVTLNFDASLRKVSGDGVWVSDFTDLGGAYAIIAEPRR